MNYLDWYNNLSNIDKLQEKFNLEFVIQFSQNKEAIDSAKDKLNIINGNK
jgi:hypothetical protein